MRMGATHFLIKRLPKVATEMALRVLAYNLTRVMNIMDCSAGGRDASVSQSPVTIANSAGSDIFQPKRFARLRPIREMRRTNTLTTVQSGTYHSVC
jgi:hypothetical protein